MILNVEYYSQSSLATHRIDPLILSEKIVVSFHSSDVELDQVYAPLVHFTSETDLVHNLHKVIESYHDYSTRMSSGWVKRYIARTLMDLTPLCSALNSVKDHKNRTYSVQRFHGI